MLDISIAELGVAGIVAMLILGPKEFAKTWRYTKSILAKLQRYFNDFNKSIEHEIDDIEGYIIGKDGQSRPSYNLKGLQNDKEDKNQKKYKGKKTTGHKRPRKKDI